MYNALKHREIRLATLEPGTHQDPLRCSLRVVSLDAQPAYEALSYCWKDVDHSRGWPYPTDLKDATPDVAAGDPPHGWTVLLDGEPLSITWNLDSALRGLRRPDAARVLWCDALCINQASEAERAAQVAIMGDIFAATAGLLVWAGNASADSGLALETVRAVDAELDADAPATGGCLQATATYRRLVEGRPWDRAVAAPWAAIVRLFLRRWWSRAWTVQEVYLPRGPMTFACGPNSVPWTALDRVMRAMLKHTWYLRSTDVYGGRGQDVLAAALLLTQRAEWQLQREQFPLLSHLGHHFSRGCERPHDKVYAFLGISADVADGDIPVDYNMPVEELYQVAAVQGARYFTLDFLALSQTYGRRLTGLPSWVPDWTVPQARHPNRAPGGELTACAGMNVDLLFVTLETKGAFLGMAAFSAAIDVNDPTFADRPCELKTRGRCLLVEGLMHSRVHALAPQLVLLNRMARPELVLEQLLFAMHHAPDLCATGLHHVDALHRTIAAHGKPQPFAAHPPFDAPVPCASGQRRVEAFWRTLVADRHFEGGLARATATSHAYTRYGHPWLCGDGEHVKWFDYLNFAFDTLAGRRLFVDGGGAMGLVPVDARVEDRICLVKGMEVPLLLRPRPDGTWEVIGECYVHGIMDGEGLRGVRDGTEQFQELVLG